MRHCDTCEDWIRYSIKYPNNLAEDAMRDGGICQSSKLIEGSDEGYAIDALVYPYDEGGEFWTGAKFGCVHHRHRPLTTDK